MSIASAAAPRIRDGGEGSSVAGAHWSSRLADAARDAKTFDWADLLERMEGAHPLDVAAVFPPPHIDAIPTDHTDSPTPELHPLDFEWYFDRTTARRLAELCLRRGTGLLGTPTVAREAAHLGIVPQLIDRSPSVSMRLDTWRVSAVLSEQDLDRPLASPFESRFEPSSSRTAIATTGKKRDTRASCASSGARMRRRTLSRGCVSKPTMAGASRSWVSTRSNLASSYSRTTATSARIGRAPCCASYVLGAELPSGERNSFNIYTPTPAGLRVRIVEIGSNRHSELVLDDVLPLVASETGQDAQTVTAFPGQERFEI